MLWPKQLSSHAGLAIAGLILSQIAPFRVPDIDFYHVPDKKESGYPKRGRNERNSVERRHQLFPRAARNSGARRAWECNINGYRVWIGSGHRYFPGQWVMNCSGLDISGKVIANVTECDDQAAQKLALSVFSKSARRAAATLLTAANMASAKEVV